MAKHKLGCNKKSWIWFLRKISVIYFVSCLHIYIRSFDSSFYQHRSICHLCDQYVWYLIRIGHDYDCKIFIWSSIFDIGDWLIVWVRASRVEAEHVEAGHLRCLRRSCTDQQGQEGNWRPIKRIFFLSSWPASAASSGPCCPSLQSGEFLT